jgi:hypothetical protein
MAAVFLAFEVLGNYRIEFGEGSFAKGSRKCISAAAS